MLAADYPAPDAAFGALDALRNATSGKARHLLPYFSIVSLNVAFTAFVHT